MPAPVKLPPRIPQCQAKKSQSNSGSNDKSKSNKIKRVCFKIEGNTNASQGNEENQKPKERNLIIDQESEEGTKRELEKHNISKSGKPSYTNSILKKNDSSKAEEMKTYINEQPKPEVAKGLLKENIAKNSIIFAESGDGSGKIITNTGKQTNKKTKDELLHECLETLVALERCRIENIQKLKTIRQRLTSLAEERNIEISQYDEPDETSIDVTELPKDAMKKFISSTISKLTPEVKMSNCHSHGAAPNTNNKKSGSHSNESLLSGRSTTALKASQADFGEQEKRHRCQEAEMFDKQMTQIQAQNEEAQQHREELRKESWKELENEKTKLRRHKQLVAEKLQHAEAKRNRLLTEIKAAEEKLKNKGNDDKSILLSDVKKRLDTKKFPTK